MMQTNCPTYPSSTSCITVYPDTNIPDTGVLTYTYPWNYQYPATTCSGKSHYFDCDHVKVCQCGKVERVMKPAKKAKR